MPSDNFSALRKAYHRELCKRILGIRERKAYSIADVDNKTSVKLADMIVKKIGFPTCVPPASQTCGSLFSKITLDYLSNCFGLLMHLRPGHWVYSVETAIGQFEQYSHLQDLQHLLQEHEELKAALGGNYLITPDIVIAREPVSDVELNRKKILVNPGEKVAGLSPLRASNLPGLKILHASISCKWTMRSDRAQNTRTEALNLIRNRKGNLPHIAAVTMEPLPTRLASIALGTGDVDCTYHAALYELMEACNEAGYVDQGDLLKTMVEGRRLRDISDLPLDLAI